MQSIYNPTDNAELIQRINQLTPNTKPEWGKMNVEQMLAHCQEPIKVALGEAKLKHSLIGFLFGGLAKKKMLGEEAFQKNLPTDKSFIIKESKNFSEEKNKLAQLIKRTTQVGATGITKDPHPFFGKLTIEEWDKLLWKHLDHHLRQFGV